jgi:nucleoside 2-deoxyribosyltransferase
MPQPKIKCFVASAFGQKDVDTIFDKAIRPVVRAKDLDFTVVRIDRHEHNEDIDKKIFELLDASQICIADLTYARPSVYYEAGYAHASGKPVVYIARGDHFKNKEDDLRVHFDLQMKNIIPWTTANDSFKNALRKRLKLVAKALLKQRAALELEKQSVAAFAALSQNARLSRILERAGNVLRAHGFHRQQAESPNRNIDTFAVFRRDSHGACDMVAMVARPSFSKQDLRLYGYLHMYLTGDFTGIRSIRSAALLFALNSIRHSNVAGVFPHRTPLAPNILQGIPSTAFVGTVQVRETLVVIDSVRSDDDAAQRLWPALTMIGFK